MMKDKKLPDLIIRDLVINPPIIQGGMGVRVSTDTLASAVSNEGALGVIASVGLGEEFRNKLDYLARSEQGLRLMVRKAKQKTKLPIGCNIMVALTNYDTLVKASTEEGVDIIFSGAGLPLRLPALVDNKKVRLGPIVSSGRAADLICKTWIRRYGILPDVLVVEGPLAGGHLGFNFDDLKQNKMFDLKKLVSDVLRIVDEYKKSYNKEIPVVAAGGIFDGKDIAAMLKLGASGVQIATRFVCTYECDVHPAFKEAFLKAKKEDVVIIQSPVGMPGRVIKNKFIERVIKGEKIKFDCPMQCLKPCNKEEVNYCIAEALVEAAYKGNFDKGFAMCGENVYKVDKIVSVKDLLKELAEGAIKELYA